MAIFKKYQQEGIPQTQRYKYSDAVNIGNEPIIQKDIPVSIDSRTPTNNQFTRRTNDLGRIAKLLTQKPGLKYIANETALGVVQQDVENYWDKQKKPKDRGLGGNLSDKLGDKIRQVGKGLLGTGKILATTLAQVPVNGTGTHFVRGNIKDLIGSIIPPGATELLGGGDTDKGFDILPAAPNFALVSYSNEDNNGYYEKDLIKFRFSIVQPTEDQGTPILYKHLIFKAYLSEFTDNFNGDWNSWKYNGRAENFYTYNGFERDVSIGFKIAATSQQELQPIYTKMVELASVTAPTYSGGGTMKGNFVKVTVGDYLANIPGIITNVSYSWNTEYPWDIAKKYSPSLNNPGQDDKDTQQLPTVLDCSLSFTPIHTFVPQQGIDKDQEQFFITRKDKNFDISKPSKGQMAAIAQSLGRFGGS